MDVTQNLPSGCMICKKTTGVSSCANCHVAKYCGPDHQSSDWKNHKRACLRIKKALKVLQDEETNLNNKPGDFMFEEKPFENSVGHFWGILETRDYMRARFAVARQMLESFDTREAVECARGHFLDMLRLNRSDNMGLRDMVPHVMLRLGEDQPAYDFLRWWADAGSASDYDFGDIDLPHLDTKDADAFESVNNLFVKRYPDISHTVAVTLIKLRMLKDLEYIQSCRNAIGSKLPEELLNQVQQHTLTSSIIYFKKETYVSQDNTKLIATLQSQVLDLLKATHKANKHMWLAIVDPQPDKNLSANPEYYSAGQPSEMQNVLIMCYKAWKETPNAIEWLNELLNNREHI